MKLSDNKQNTDESKGVLCASFRDGAPALLLHTLDGKRWVMPWVHFLHAYHEKSGESEQIGMFYSNHEILIEGVRLQPLVERLSKYDLEWVKCFSKRYLKLCPQDLPFIERITIEEKADE